MEQSIATKIELEADFQLKLKAAELTVQHFMDKSCNEEAFMKHLERLYNFLKNGRT